MRTIYLYCYDCQTQESFLDEVDEREIKEGVNETLDSVISILHL